jgi:hypothetical protein
MASYGLTIQAGARCIGWLSLRFRRLVMEPTLIANKKISFKEIRIKVIQKNVFSCPVFAFLGLFGEIFDRV